MEGVIEHPSLHFSRVFCCGLLRRILPAFRAKFALDSVSSHSPAANCARVLAERVLAAPRDENP